jgi:predicted O-linked N-acetylglucosamine transferase (SPINDLY family)
MGLPVLTFLGKSFASRVTASLLSAVGLTELIISSQEEYEAMAIELGKNPKKLKAIKDKLAKNLPSAPLYDTPLFTTHLESAYKTMYEKYQQGLETNHIYVQNSN